MGFEPTVLMFNMIKRHKFQRELYKIQFVLKLNMANNEWNHQINCSLITLTLNSAHTTGALKISMSEDDKWQYRKKGSEGLGHYSLLIAK